MGSSSNRYAPRLPQQETKSSTKLLAPTWVRKTFSEPASLKRASLVARPVAMSHKVTRKPKHCTSATLIQKTLKMNLNMVPKMGPWDHMRSLVKEQKKSTFTVPFWDRLAIPKWDRKIAKSTAKADPCNKNYNSVYLSNQHIELEQRRPAHAKPDFTWLLGPRNGTWKRTCGIRCGDLRCGTTQATFTNPQLRATPLLRAMF